MELGIEIGSLEYCFDQWLILLSRVKSYRDHRMLPIFLAHCALMYLLLLGIWLGVLAWGQSEFRCD